MNRAARLACLVAFLALTCIAATFASLQPLPDKLEPPLSAGKKLQVLDRDGTPLSRTFANDWNLTDQRALHEIPLLLQRAVIESEDKRFYEHSGVDWRARVHALLQNLQAGRIVRGASTISEQVIGMLHPRRRSLWGRFIEGVEAWQLETRFSKAQILEFYLNQVPYAAKRRGVAQAARYYWDRDLETLTQREQLALAVMVRAPERLDLHKDIHRVDQGIALIAARLSDSTQITETERVDIMNEQLTLRGGALPVRADHFVQMIYSSAEGSANRVVTTLSAALQARVQSILDHRIADLRQRQVSDGAALVVDNGTGEVLAWVNAGTFGDSDGSQIDAIRTPRQPGSTLKPFVYALALDRGWTAATIIDDSPLAEGVGAGLHNYRNYSRTFYGPITLREALGNSLNIPAIKTIQFTGKQELLELLRNLGISSLSHPADFYGEGLALGNGEVTLFELVQAYTTFAHRGAFRPLTLIRSEAQSLRNKPTKRVFSPEVSSIVSHILSDPYARQREFGSSGLLRFPVQTAIKTGTSTDYRDAWAIGYSENFTVGVWMGNLNRTSMHEITGARGPALVLRSIFAELERTKESLPLFESPALLHRSICSSSGLLAGPHCTQIEERFVPSTEPRDTCSRNHEKLDAASSSPIGQSDTTATLQIILPTPGLHIARDPRIPDEQEAFPFEVISNVALSEITWRVDDKQVATTPGKTKKFLWSLTPGHHELQVEGRPTDGGAALLSQRIGFWVR